jgi:hypothetical protein
MTHKFEEYPDLSEMMQEYACFGSFSDWQKFTDALNNALIKAENLPIQNVRLSCLQDVWQKWCDSKTTKEFDEWLHEEMHEA